MEYTVTYRHVHQSSGGSKWVWPSTQILQPRYKIFVQFTTHITILVHSPPVIVVCCLSYPVPYSILRIILQSTSEKCVCCCVMCLFKVNKAFFFQSIATSFSCFLWDCIHSVSLPHIRLAEVASSETIIESEEFSPLAVYCSINLRNSNYSHWIVCHAVPVIGRRMT